MKKLLLLVALTLAVTATAHAAGGIPLWTNRYNGPANLSDQANAVVVDSSGNVLVTGYSTGTASSRDYLTFKYSNDGVPLWTNRYNGPANGADTTTALAVDSSGNVLVAGQSHGGIGSFQDYATIKYSGAGVGLWTNRYNGPTNSFDEATAVAVDGSGNVLVAGRSDGIGSNGDYATIKYSGTGVPLWTNRYNGPGNYLDHAHAIAVDISGNVFVTGYSYGGASNDYATIKYSSGGVPLWTNRYGGGLPRAMALDNSGNVFVTGNTYATIKYSSAGVSLWTNRYDGPGNGNEGATALAVDASGNVAVTGNWVTNGGLPNVDSVTVKYSGAGVPLWTNRYNGPGNIEDTASAVAVDSSGNVFVTGITDRIASSSGDWATIAYSSGGVPLWTNRYNGPGNHFDEAKAIAVDANGNVFVTGISNPNGSGTDYDFTTIKYSSSVPASPRLDYRGFNNQLVLSWTNAGFTLQAAPVVPGAFTNIPAATSPFTNPLTGAQQFFRLISN